MSSPRDPERLENDCPPELKRIIRSLRNDAPSQAGMRMAQKLDSTCDSPPTIAGGSGESGGSLLKLGLALLASASLLVVVLHPQQSSKEGDAEPVL